MAETKICRKIGSCNIYKVVEHTPSGLAVIRLFDVYNNRVIRNTPKERSYYNDLVEIKREDI